MTTKGKIAWIVMKSLGGGVVTNFRKVDPRDVYERISSVWSAMLSAMFEEYGDIDGEFVTHYKDIPVECDADTKEKYSILPVKLLSFGEQVGVRQVSPMKNQAESFIKMTNGAESTYAPLEAGKLHGNIGYYIQRVKDASGVTTYQIRYKNIPFEYDKVLIKMIAPIDDFGEDENIPIPAKYEDELINRVGQEFDPQFKVPQDLKSDLAPNQ